MQTSINETLAIGVPGQIYDGTPRRIKAMPVANGLSTRASGKFTFSSNAEANDTVSINGRTYTFKAAVSTTADEVKIGSSAADTAANLAHAINGTGTSGSTGVYGNGTKPNVYVTASASSGVATITARDKGSLGNSIILAASAATAAAMSGGTDGSENCAIGRAVTAGSIEGVAQIGGSGAFLGLTVDQHSIVLHGGLEPSMAVPEGSALPVCSFGHIVVSTLAAATPYSSKPTYRLSDGAISAAASDAVSAPDGFAFIPNARFIEVSASADGLAVLELN